MNYPYFGELPDLLERKLISKKSHPSLPLDIYNYTASAQFLPIAEWTPALCDCRGLILDRTGGIVGHPFRKFWNYEQVLSQVPAGEGFTVWEKLDGSLGIVACHAGDRVIATRGSFESEQARWLKQWMDRCHDDFYPDGTTWLFEVIFPENRIVVDYGRTSEAFLLSVMDDTGADLWDLFESSTRFRKARRFDGITDFSVINSDPKYQGQEGFVVQWASGMRAKIKAQEYVRLHRLITQCSTRTIWELLRTGQRTQELLDRVPPDFYQWAQATIGEISNAHACLLRWAEETLALAPCREPRKDFAMWAKQQAYPGLLFSKLDGKDVTDAAWRIVEPKWATPFRKEAAE